MEFAKSLEIVVVLVSVLIYQFPAQYPPAEQQADYRVLLRYVVLDQVTLALGVLIPLGDVALK